MNALLSAGDTISFSAGDRALHDTAFRVVRPHDDRLSQVVRQFPHLASALQKTPVVVNCYPAYLGRFASAITCDTYLRPSTFHRALLVALERGYPAIVLGQPLVVLDLLLRHTARRLPLPSPLLICTGGYYCPESMERVLRLILSEQKIPHWILHAYGMAEVDFAVFVGERSSSGGINYRPVAPHVDYRILEHQLQLRLADNGPWQDTGDFAKPIPSGLRILPGARLHPSVLSTLESWSPRDWECHTGYLARVQDRLVFQRRLPEPEYWEFCKTYGMSFTEKPNWSHGSAR